MIVYAQVHEDVHAAIYSSYGVNSYSSINYFTGKAYTQATGNYSSCNENCQYTHNLNEIIGYNVALILFTACLLVFVVLLSLIAFEKTKDETKPEKTI